MAPAAEIVGHRDDVHTTRISVLSNEAGFFGRQCPDCGQLLRLRTYYPSPGTAAAAVAGEVNLATAPALHAALLDALNTHSPVILDADLSAWTFLACAGLTVLVRAHATTRVAGCQTWASHPRGPVRRVLEITGLLDVFTAPRDASSELSSPGLMPTGPQSD